MKSKFLLAGAIVAAIPAAASASITITGISGNPGFATGNVIYTPGGIGGNPARTSQDLLVGRMRLTGIDTATNTAVAFDSYCIDIFNYMQPGTFELQTFSLANATKEDQLKRLLSETAGAIDAAFGFEQKRDVSAAVQMAVWEIVNESGTTGYSLDGGLFRMGTTGSVALGARSLAQGYLNNLDSFAATGAYSYQMLAAVNPVTNQRQVFLAAAVPEPATWAMFIAGFGIMGAAMRRRPRNKLAFA